ncbi:MFS transporter [Paraburkholderia sp. Ac-20342]|uniref:MFS transporter n=1 Tax=Paraburkholderia sp. Ac-20342 TaxID=2703889 RepID=UPI001F12072C|nr:MFS transporter [Paraburkholderia sp. Ac-20342]MBN3846687.1 MFS transporter [Paraburkholderia sp. Ac-20342]
MSTTSMNAAPITVEDWLATRRVNVFQIFTTVLCGLAVFLDGISTQIIGYTAPAIHNALHLDHQQMGTIFSTGLLGLLIGGFSCSVLADLYGRRRMLIACTIIFGIFTVATGMATSPSEMLAWRFIAGLGLGGAMPTAITLTAEIAPARARSVMVMSMFCGFPAGGAIAGVLVSSILPCYGWEAVFYTAGAVSLIVALALIMWLPESLVFLVNRNADAARIEQAKQRISPLSDIVEFTRDEKRSSTPVAGLFQEGRAPGTLILWVIYFISLLEIYFLASWLPTVLNSDGRSLANAALGTSLMQFGGVAGTFVFGRFMDRLNPHRVLMACYLLGCFFIGSIGFLYKSSIILPTLFLGGMFLIGAQSGLSAVSSVFYPTSARATGVGWNLGVGRIGSICGPMVGALLLSKNFSVQSMFIWIAVPMFIAAIFSMVLQYVRPKNS